MQIRLATADDASQLLAVYGPAVASSPASFELDPPTVETMRRRVVDTLALLPWLVHERDGVVLGYAYAAAHRTRAAYRWSADVSVYVAPAAQGSGIGRGLYRALLGFLLRQGYYQAFAGIALPNPASVALHRALGFQQVGIYRSVGYKLGAWHDVGWWQLTLRPPAAEPLPPVPLPRLRKEGECTKPS